MKTWATAKSIKREIADVTDKYLDLFGVYMPEYTRKYGDGVTGTLVFHSGKLLECIERGVRFKTSDCLEGYGPHVPDRSAALAEIEKSIERANAEAMKEHDVH